MEPNGSQESAAEEQRRSKRQRAAPSFFASASVPTKDAPPSKKKAKRTETRATKLKREHGRKQEAKVRQRRAHRKQERKQLNTGGRVVCKNDNEVFYEVEKVVGKRTNKKGGVEWKIRWKGCPESEDSWEPEMLLCDSALEEAKLFEEKQREMETRSCLKPSVMTGVFNGEESNKVRCVLEESKVPSKPAAQVSTKEPPSCETAAGVDAVRPADMVGPTRDGEPSNSSIPKPLKASYVYAEERCEVGAHAAAMLKEDELPWAWNDEEQVVFRPVVRINVHDSDACERVTEARTNGTPVVLVGQRGWAGFASRWLVDQDEDDGQLLDLSKPHQLDITGMMNDIGEEDVPIVARNYDETNPTKRSMKARDFLEAVRSDFSVATAPSGRAANQIKHYLHQWQFPVSDTARAKLCHQSNPLPNNILGEEMLKYSLDDELSQCALDNPYQYLFMGAEGTMSKLHCDRGGLAITIAPIVGEKECVLVHRGDGDCLYNLDAKLDKINLQDFPLVSQARVWKTTVRPGEILLLPQGTYHQCRNLTACLSYSRFHLDTVNIRAFFQSMVDGDAKEIDHEMILYNSAHELTEKVDDYVEKVQDHVRAPKRFDNVPLSTDMICTVKTLRCLRNFCREIDRRKAVQTRIKGSPIVAGVTPAAGPVTDARQEREWHTMTGEIDMCLHEFRYCRMKKKPTFRLRAPGDATLSVCSGEGAPIVADPCGSSFEKAFLRLPDISDAVALPEHAEPSVNDIVTVHLMGKSVKGEILEVRSGLSAALVSYEEHPGVFDEYQPFHRLRVPRSGEAPTEVKEEHVKPGLVVVTKNGGVGEDYRGVVVSTASGTFYRVRLLELGKKQSVDRWLTKESIVSIEEGLPNNGDSSTSKREKATENGHRESPEGADIMMDVASMPTDRHEDLREVGIGSSEPREESTGSELTP